MKLSCRFGWHEWGKWSSCRIQMALYNHVTGQTKEFTEIGQERSCTVCGKQQTRKV